jgi:hypothetical protein
MCQLRGGHTYCSVVFFLNKSQEQLRDSVIYLVMCIILLLI